MGMKGVFGGLCQATVLGLEDRSEGHAEIRDEEEGNNRRRCWRRRGRLLPAEGQWSRTPLKLLHAAPLTIFYVFISCV